VANAVAEAQHVAAGIIRVRAKAKHVHEGSWKQKIKEAKEEVSQERKENRREYMKVVRRIHEIQAMVRKFIQKRRGDREREEEGLRDAKRREKASYRVTRAMKTNLDKGKGNEGGDKDKSKGVDEAESGRKGSGGGSAEEVGVEGGQGRRGGGYERESTGGEREGGAQAEEGKRTKGEKRARMEEEVEDEDGQQQKPNERSRGEEAREEVRKDRWEENQTAREKNKKIAKQKKMQERWEKMRRKKAETQEGRNRELK
jgi:hypothetical protein